MSVRLPARPSWRHIKLSIVVMELSVCKISDLIGGMKSRSKTALIAITILGAAVTWLLLLRGHEPGYNGEKLSHWVILLGQAKAGLGAAEDQQDAIQQIGTNALPFLVKWITFSEARDLRLFGVPFALPTAHRKAELAYGSSAAFAVLGPRAATALPDLVRLVHETNQAVFYRILSAIDTVGGNLGTNAGVVVPPLMKLLNGPDAGVAGFAAIELGKIGRRTQTDAIVAAFVRATESADHYVRYGAVYGLGELGPLAQVAVPALVRTLDDPDHWVRRTATNSLSNVLPQFFETKKAEHGL
jgi:hypothetical protein